MRRGAEKVSETWVKCYSSGVVPNKASEMICREINYIMKECIRGKEILVKRSNEGLEWNVT